MWFTQKIDNYGWLSSYNKKKKNKKYLGSHLSETTAGGKHYSPTQKKPKIYYLKITVRIYISLYSEISSGELFRSTGHGEKDKKSSRRHWEIKDSESLTCSLSPSANLVHHRALLGHLYSQPWQQSLLDSSSKALLDDGSISFKARY